MLGSSAEFERVRINQRTRNKRIERLNENRWVEELDSLCQSHENNILSLAIKGMLVTQN